MERQKIATLLDKTDNNPSKFKNKTCKIQPRW